MNTLSIRLRYRPLRLGWCVLSGDIDAFRQAVRLSFTMWGGRFNPIIPVDTPELAEMLVRLFRVDALVPLSQGDVVEAFLNAHKYLPWPLITRELFRVAMDGRKNPTIVDISHPINQMFDELYRNNPNPDTGLDLYEWQPDDPLGDLFLCSYGSFPSPDDTGVDYGAMAEASLRGVRNSIRACDEVPIPQMGRHTIGR